MLGPIFEGLSLLDNALAQWLPFLVRVLIWGVLSGALSMVIYSWVSNQDKIRTLKNETKSLRKQMMNPDIEQEEYMRLTKVNLRVSMYLLRVTLGPALIGAAPVLVMLLWFAMYNGFALPEPGTPIGILPSPETAQLELDPVDMYLQRQDARVVIVPPEPILIKIMNGGNTVYSGNPWSPPTPVITTKTWWNWIIPNPAGYLDDKGELEKINLGFPRKSIAEGSTAWWSSWELWFILAVFASTLFIKIVFKVE